MSVRVMSLVFEAGSLTASQKAVLLALADHANEDGLSVYPAVWRLEIKTAIGERAIRKILGQLRKAGLLIVVAEATQHRATEYRIDLAKLRAMRHPALVKNPDDALPRGESGAPLKEKKSARGESGAGLGVSRGESGAPLEGEKMPKKAPGVNLVPPRGESGAPESSLNHQLKNHREEEVEVNARAASASSEIPTTPKQALEHPDILIFNDATGRIPGQRDYGLVIETVRLLAARFETRAQLTAYLARFWLAWSGRRRRSDGRPYDPGSLTWLTEWAVNNSIPADSGKQPERAMPAIDPERQAESAAAAKAMVAAARAAKRAAGKDREHVSSTNVYSNGD